jgi:malate synthase
MAPAKKSKRKGKAKPARAAAKKTKKKAASAKTRSRGKLIGKSKPKAVSKVTKGASYRIGGAAIHAARGPRFDEILTKEALAFVTELHKKFEKKRADLMTRRTQRQARFDKGELPDFLAETRKIRETDWKSASCRKISSIAASKSPVRSTARWW